MLTENERDELISFIINCDKLNLSEKDYLILQHLLQLIHALNLRASLLKAKEAKEEAEKRKLKIERGMSFSNCEKRIRDEYAT